MLQADQCLGSYFLDSRYEFDSWVKTHESEASAHPSHSRHTLRVFQLLKTSVETTEKNGDRAFVLKQEQEITWHIEERVCVYEKRWIDHSNITQKHQTWALRHTDEEPVCCKPLTQSTSPNFKLAKANKLFPSLVLYRKQSALMWLQHSL